MKIKKILISLIFVLAVQTPGYCWLFDKPDAELLQEALQSDKPAKVNRCLDRQMALRNYTAVLQLKQHAVQMTQKERGRINGIPGSTFQDMAKTLDPWKKIIAKADAFTMNKNALQPQAAQQ